MSQAPVHDATAIPSVGGGGDAVLVVRNLRVTFVRDGQRHHALRGLDLTVGAGEIVALVGESGSGKSTLGYAAAGLLSADSHPDVSGSIKIGGVDVVQAGPATLRRLRREHLGAVFQDPMTSLNPTMRIGRQLGEAGGELPVATMLERVGLGADGRLLGAYPHQLSGGQQQRVMIAMAMARQPRLVVADEPTTALDVTVQAQILQLFRQLRDDSGTSILFVTHDLAVAASIADRVAVMYGGRIVEYGPIHQVVRRPAHPYSAALLEARFDLVADKHHQLPTLPGEPPPSDTTPIGCLFAPRCAIATPICFREQPQALPAAQHSGVTACWHSSEVQLGMWKSEVSTWPTPAATSADLPVLDLSEAWVVFAAGRRSAPMKALRGVSLQVQPGESVGVVGESGSGKSTLLRVAAGLRGTTSGRVDWPTGDRPQLVYQDAAASLTPWLRVSELLGEPFRRTTNRRERDIAVAEALARVGLPDVVARLRPGQLSGGQRQRVAVARAIAVPPELLLCDEPISAMDVSLAAMVLNLLGSLRRQLGMAMLFVTHDIAAARYVADRIVVMRAGEIVEDGPADAIVTHPTHPYTRELLGSMPTSGGDDHG